MPRGGTISTIVTKAPSWISRPSRDRSETCTGGVSVTIGSCCEARWLAAWASVARRADFMARICCAVVPQQPPMYCTPARVNLRAKLAIYSGEHK